MRIAEKKKSQISFTGKLVSGMGLFAKALKQKGYHVIDVEEI